MSLPDIGTLRYGPVTFTSLFHSNVQATAIKDRGERATKIIKCVLTVSGCVFAGDVKAGNTTDGDFQIMRTELEKVGSALVYDGKGFGRVRLNTGGGSVDPMMGPIPEVLDFEPMGAARSALVTWRVTFHLLPTSNSIDLDSPLVLSFDREDDIDFDDRGYMVLTISGEIEIAAFRRLGNLPVSGLQEITPSENILQHLRDYLDVLAPTGMKPQARKFHIQNNRRTATFSYQWKEIPIGGVPIGCMHAGGSYSINPEKPGGLFRWVGRLSANYSVRKDVTRNTAYLRFLSLYKTKSPFPHNVNEYARLAVVQRNQFRVFLVDFRVTEGQYEDSDSVEFEAQWTYTTDIRSLFRTSHSFEPNPDSDYIRWFNTMGFISGYRSWMKVPGLDDRVEIVIDVDHQPPTRQFPANFRNERVGSTLTPRRQSTVLVRNVVEEFGDIDEKDHPDFKSVTDNTAGAIQSTRFTGLPAPENSWINYQNDITIVLDPGIAVHKTLPQKNDAYDSLGSVDYQDKKLAADIAGVNLNSNSSGVDVAQRMATSTYRIILSGVATRAGYPVSPPTLKDFGGQTPVPIVPQIVRYRTYTTQGGIPIFTAVWQMAFQVVLPPKIKTPLPYPQKLDENIQPKFDKVPQDVPFPDGVFGVPVQQPTAPGQTNLQNIIQG